MRVAMNARDRRALIVGAVALGAFVTAAKGIPRLREWEVQQVSRALTAKVRLQRLERGARERGKLAGAREQWHARRLGSDSLLFTVVDVGALGAQLAGTIRSIALANEVVLHGVQPRTDSSRARAFVRASASVSATADVESLMGFLVSLEATRPMLRITELSLVQAEPNPAEDRADNLKIEMTVQGLARVAPRSSSASAR